MKKIIALLVLVTAIVLAFTSCELLNYLPEDLISGLIPSTPNTNHEHVYGEWETKTPANCEDAEVEVRKCACGTEETREGDAALGHTVVSISAEYVKSAPMQGDVLVASDFTVSTHCHCGASAVVTEGVTLENATLANVGENTVTVNYGGFSTTVVVNAEKYSLTLNGTLVEDTYVSTDKKNDNYISRDTMGTNSSTFRVFFKFNFSNILANDAFVANKDNAKVQFTFTIVEGAYTEETTFSFGGFIPGEVVSNFDFADITWNTVRNTDMDWANAIYPIDQAVGSHHVDFNETTLTLTFTYDQIKDFIDADGNAIFTFRAKQSGVKISSKEGASAPAVKVIVDDTHLHAFDQRIESEEYFISANCDEPTYYFKSCRCGEHGDDYFKTETINEHKFGNWDVITSATCTETGKQQRTCTLCENGIEEEDIPVLGHEYDEEITPPTCNEAGYTTYTCIRGDHTYTGNEVNAKGHTSNNVWDGNDSYHWNNCVDCGTQMNSATHNGGTATETEQAICETCNKPYGGLASHVHNHSAVVTPPTCTEAGYTTYTCGCGDVYTADETPASGHAFGAWEVVHPATCEGDELLIHHCDCGESETGTGSAAFGHDMQTKYDETNHWTECAHNCGKSTEAIAHFGGEATTTEQATCEGCGQPYGNLLPEGPKEVTVNGTILDDTYINSSTSNNMNEKDSMGTYNNSFKIYLKYNLSDFLATASEEDKANAKVQFSFAITEGSATDSTKVTLKSFTVSDLISRLDFSNDVITWSNVKSGKDYYALNWADKGKKLVEETPGDKVVIEDGMIYVTVDFSAIEKYIDANGNILIAMATNTSGLKIASMENTSYAAPAVKVTYTK